MLTASQLKANGSPRSSAAAGGRSGSGRSATASASVLKQVAEKEKQGRKLFSSVKTPQRDQRRECKVSSSLTTFFFPLVIIIMLAPPGIIRQHCYFSTKPDCRKPGTKPLQGAPRNDRHQDLYIHFKLYVGRLPGLCFLSFPYNTTNAVSMLLLQLQLFSTTTTAVCLNLVIHRRKYQTHLLQLRCPEYPTSPNPLFLQAHQVPHP
jgi:hypothetical protein